MSAAVQLPRWDMAKIFSSIQSAEFERDFQALVDDIADFERLLNQHSIDPGHPPEREDRVVAFEAAVTALDQLHRRLHTLAAYLRSFVTTDSFDTAAQARSSELQRHTIRLSQAETRLTAWLGSLPLGELKAQSAIARDLNFPLDKIVIEARHLMSLPEEDLAAELRPSGAAAWTKLYGTLTSQLSVPIEMDGQRRDLPMSAIRNLAYAKDRTLRQVAYEAEIEAWKRAATPIAAALNSIKGETNAIEGRRGWDTALDYALFLANIDRQTFDAMMAAAQDSFPDFRRYLRSKSSLLGLPVLTWYDLFAPVGEASRTWTFEEAQGFLRTHFGTYSPRLRDFSERAFQERWIDAEPRPGKVGGAFCMWLRGDESRILTNYMPTYDGVSTLAHELGHAYHNLNLASRSMMQRGTPMTLAETASIFCETIIEHAALERAEREEQIAILEASIQSACQLVVDICSRFRFEQEVFSGRLLRELSVDELNELMLASQQETYGDGLDSTQLHPYMWAAKGHYYSAARPYYNFPYMFGFLFGLGLYSRYQDEPDRFRRGYDELLSATGMADAATLAAGFGIDIRTPDFWKASLDIVRTNIDRFVTLVADRTGKQVSVALGPTEQTGLEDTKGARHG